MLDNKISFVIPTYNEEINIPIIYEKIIEVMKSIDHNFEIIYVNDGSSDNSIKILTELALKNKKIKFIDLSRNFGHQAALSAGYDYANGEAIISLDCDLQDPPEIIELLITKWKEGYDIVYARRIKRSDHFFKKFTAKFYYRLLSRFGDINIPRDVGDFRLINRKVLNIINHMPEKSKYLRGMVAWVGFRHTFVDYERPERIHGKTNYTLQKMITLSLDGLINFSNLPLKIGLVMGFISISTGFLFILYMILDSLFNDSIYPLYKWLIVLLFIFLGFNFVLIWILGEYIGRIYKESRNRPYYIINYTKNFDENFNA